MVGADYKVQYVEFRTVCGIGGLDEKGSKTYKKDLFTSELI